MSVIKNYINSIITIVLMVGIGLLPPFGSITELGMDILGVFVGVVYGWCTCSFIWTSILAMLLLAITGYDTFTSIASTGFGDTNFVISMFTVLVFMGFIEKTKCMEWVAKKLLSLQVIKGKPWLLCGLMFLISGFIGGFTNAIAIVILLWSIVYSVCDEVGLDKRSEFISFTSIGIVAFGSFSNSIWPFMPMTAAGIGLISRGSGVPVADIMGPWYIMGPLTMLIIIVCYVLLGKFIFRLDASKLKNADLTKNTVVATNEQKLGLAFLIIFVTALVIPMIFPDTWFITKVFSNWGLIGTALLLICAACFVKDADGKHTYEFADMAKGVNWNLVIMFIASVPICNAFESEGAGIITTITEAAMPFVLSLGPAMFTVVACLIFVIVTQVAHNLILMLVFTSVFVSFACQLGLNGAAFGMLFYFSLQTALMTPGASVFGALAFGNEHAPRTHIIKYTTCYVAFAFVLLMVLIWPLANMMF